MAGSAHLPGVLVAMGSRSGPLAGTAPELHQVLPPSLSDLPARVFHEMVLLGHHEHWTQPGHPPPSSPLLTQAPLVLELGWTQTQPFYRTLSLPCQPQTQGTLLSGFSTRTQQSIDGERF